MYLNLSSCVSSSIPMNWYSEPWYVSRSLMLLKYPKVSEFPLGNVHECSVSSHFVWCLHYFELPFDLTTDLLYELKLLYTSSQIKYISGWGHDIHYHHPEHKTMPLINKLLDLEPPGTTYNDFLFSSQYHFGLLWKWREWNIWISSRQCIVEE